MFERIDSFDFVTSEIVKFFEENDNDFFPPISARTLLIDFIHETFIYDGCIITYRKSNKILGLVAVIFSHPIWKNYIHYIAVDSENRGSGIGKELMKQTYEMFQNIGAKDVVLTSWSTNELALKFYKNDGFFLFKEDINGRSEGVHTYYLKKQFD